MDRIEAFRIFLSVAENGSFTEASRQLGVSAGQVSKQIAALETRLKRKLFDRNTRTVRLTPDGEKLVETAGELVATMDRIETGQENEEADATGLIRMTAPVIYGARRLAPLIAEFMSHHPGISVRLSLSDRRTDLLEEGFDLALRIGEHSDTSLIGKRLTTEATRIIASDAYLKERGTPKRPAVLASHDCLIDLNMSQPRRWSFTKGSDVEAVRVSGRFESDSADAVLAAARAGLGIGLSPSWCRREDEYNGLVSILTDWDPMRPEVWILWPPGQVLPVRARLLVDFLSSRLPG